MATVANFQTCPVAGDDYPTLEQKDFACVCTDDANFEPLGSGDATCDTIIIDRMITKKTAMVIPVRLEDVLMRAIRLAPHALQIFFWTQRHTSLQSSKLPAEAIKTVTANILPFTTAFPPSRVLLNRGETNNRLCQIHHAFHCVQGSCTQHWHVPSAAGYHAEVIRYHRLECDAYQHIDDDDDEAKCWNNRPECPRAECRYEILVRSKRICCEEGHCECDCDEHDRDNECNICYCECTCRCECGPRLDSEPEAEQGCRAANLTRDKYASEIMEFLGRSQLDHIDYTGFDGDHALAFLESSQAILLQQYRRVSHILQKWFQVKLYIIMARHTPELHRDSNKHIHHHIVPMAFLYADASDEETIDTPAEAKNSLLIDPTTFKIVDNGDGNYYVNAATFAPDPVLDTRQQIDNHSDVVTNLRLAMETLQIQPWIHPMQIRPPPPPPTNTDDSGLGLDDAFESKAETTYRSRSAAEKKVIDDRKDWAKRCREMSWPKRMVMQNVVYEHDGIEVVEEDDAWIPRSR